jgi:hypothetical protein
MGVLESSPMINMMDDKDKIFESSVQRKTRKKLSITIASLRAVQIRASGLPAWGGLIKQHLFSWKACR